MFYIRADGNAAIGIGHIMRCLSIAEAVKETGAEQPVFLLADNICYNMVADRGFAAKVLGTDYRHMQSELEKLSTLLKKEDVILVDSYQVSIEYYKELEKLCKTVCLEDLGNAYPVDLLINYNIYAKQLWENYQQGSSPKKVLLGVEYMPLRKAFQNHAVYQVRDKVTDVMITTGGSDPCFAAGSIIEAIWKECIREDKNQTNKISFHIVSGPMNQYTAQLKALCAEKEFFIIYENVQNMEALIKKCDVVITAAGSTVYEVCAIGVPMICFYFAENQRQGAQALAGLTDIVNAGAFAEDKEQVVSNILQALNHCIYDRIYRERLSVQERTLVDGKGAVRLAEEIIKLQAL